jgi:hypothetical protein
MTRRIKLYFLLLTIGFPGVRLRAVSTYVYLQDAASEIQQTPTIVFRTTTTSAGSSAVTAVTSSIAGAVTGQYWPSSTTGHIITKTAGGTPTIWLTPPLSAGLTISGTIYANLYGKESNNSCNCGFRAEILRWSVAAGGFVSSLGLTADNGATEWTTSYAVNYLGFTSTSTAFVTGDRIGIVIYNDDGASVTEASGYNWTLNYGGATYVTNIEFPTVAPAFSADSNNARARPLSSGLRLPFDRFYFWDWLQQFFSG